MFRGRRIIRPRRFGRPWFGWRPRPFLGGWGGFPIGLFLFLPFACILIGLFLPMLIHP
jgi:hypothetical protein